jgi:hypothetical protein
LKEVALRVTTDALWAQEGKMRPAVAPVVIQGKAIALPVFILPNNEVRYMTASDDDVALYNKLSKEFYHDSRIR